MASIRSTWPSPMHRWHLKLLCCCVKSCVPDIKAVMNFDATQNEYILNRTSCQFIPFLFAVKITYLHTSNYTSCVAAPPHAAIDLQQRRARREAYFHWPEPRPRRSKIEPSQFPDRMTTRVTTSTTWRFRTRPWIPVLKVTSKSQMSPYRTPTHHHPLLL